MGSRRRSDRVDAENYGGGGPPCVVRTVGESAPQGCLDSRPRLQLSAARGLDLFICGGIRA